MRAGVFARNVRGFRAIRGWSQGEFAALLQWPQQTVSLIEIDKRPLQSHSELLEIAKALNVDPVLLVTEMKLPPFTEPSRAGR